MKSSKERVVKKRLADGTVKEYRYPAIKSAEPAPTQTVGALLQVYQYSPEFRALAKQSQRTYLIHIRHIEVLGNIDIALLKRKSVLSMRDALAVTSGPSTANMTVKVLVSILNWGIDREWLVSNPAARIKKLQTGHLLAWTAAEADFAEAHFPEHLRRLIVLARYTGQRRSDLVGLLWSAYSGATIRVAQQKTKTVLMIPVHPKLKVELDAWKREAQSVHILTSRSGLPLHAGTATNTVMALTRALGMREGLNIHGLRKLAAAELANAGCSIHEIAAITGHKSLSMISLYTASASQENMAISAVKKWGET
ncbi:MAG: tyrosine-type recombinase/integrase [Gluconobacter cerinus]|uniref:tyrosine-type recombinase/integrase n=1 Tax=Gluconobacter cerinus TaxID=38307 RepID=UPI0039EA654E